jgi:cell division protein FtsL
MTPPASTAAARTAQPLRRPAPPRRVSGPQRHPRAASAAVLPAPVALRLGRLVDHPLLDRVIRGRMWIAVIAFALIGIVTMQVALLKLNTGIGRAIAQVTALQRENAQLGADVSKLGAGDRITAQAAQLGMVYVPAGDVRYLAARADDQFRAASAIIAPLPAAPVSSTPAMTSTLPSQTTITAVAAVPTPGSTPASAAPPSAAVATSASSSVTGGQPPAGGAAATAPGSYQGGVSAGG